MARKKLKAEIIQSDYETSSNLCRELGWRDDRLSRIICGRQDPTDEEKRLIAEKLGIDVNKKGLWLDN